MGKLGYDGTDFWAAMKLIPEFCPKYVLTGVAQEGQAREVVKPPEGSVFESLSMQVRVADWMDQDEIAMCSREVAIWLFRIQEEHGVPFTRELWKAMKESGMVKGVKEDTDDNHGS